jgi:flagellar motor protein MotB
MNPNFKSKKSNIPEDSVTRKILDHLHDGTEEQGHEGGNNELWLVSYADLMTLLFGFFVMMYSDANHLDKIKEALQDSPTEVSQAAATPAPIATPEPLATPPPGPTQREVALEEKVRVLEKQLANGGRLLSRTPCRICVTFTSVPWSLEGELQASDSDVMILHVTRGGPGDQAGLRAGDILETVDGQDSKKPDLFKSFPIGKEVKVQYRRKGVRSETTVKLDQTSEEARKMVENEPPAPIITLYGRLKVTKIGMRERIMRYIPSDIEGLLVVENCPGCTEPGKDDVIVSVDGVPVDTPESLLNSSQRPGFMEIWSPTTRSYRVVRPQLP